ncbi:hypothetical protein D3C80_19630 [compost metagenome]
MFCCIRLYEQSFSGLNAVLELHPMSVLETARKEDPGCSDYQPILAESPPLFLGGTITLSMFYDLFIEHLVLECFDPEHAESLMFAMVECSRHQIIVGVRKWVHHNKASLVKLDRLGHYHISTLAVEQDEVRILTVAGKKTESEARHWASV